MTPARYPGTLAALLPKPDRPNDAWSKSDKPAPPVWAGNLATQRRSKS